MFNYQFKTLLEKLEQQQEEFDTEKQCTNINDDFNPIIGKTVQGSFPTIVRKDLKLPEFFIAELDQISKNNLLESFILKNKYKINKILFSMDIITPIIEDCVEDCMRDPYYFPWNFYSPSEIETFGKENYLKQTIELIKKYTIPWVVNSIIKLKKIENVLIDESELFFLIKTAIEKALDNPARKINLLPFVEEENISTSIELLENILTNTNTFEYCLKIGFFTAIDVEEKILYISNTKLQVTFNNLKSDYIREYKIEQPKQEILDLILQTAFSIEFLNEIAQWYNTPISDAKWDEFLSPLSEKDRTIIKKNWENKGRHNPSYFYFSNFIQEKDFIWAITHFYSNINDEESTQLTESSYIKELDMVFDIDVSRINSQFNKDESFVHENLILFYIPKLTEEDKQDLIEKMKTGDFSVNLRR